MSIRMMNDVWKYAPAKGSELLLLLAIADFSDDDGGNAWPSIDTLAHKTRLTRRNVQLLVRSLESRGLLEVKTNTGRNKTNRYQITMDTDERLDHDQDCASCGKPADVLHHVKPRAYGGNDHASNLMPLCDTCHLGAHSPGWRERARKGEKIMPKSLHVLKSEDDPQRTKDENPSTERAITDSPDPLFNQQEPSEESTRPRSIEELREGLRPRGLGRP